MGICMTVNNPKKDLFIIPLALFIATSVGGGVTSGHFNPAVTLAVVIG